MFCQRARERSVISRSIPVGTEADVGDHGLFSICQVEHDMLTLAEQSKQGAIEASRFEANFGAIAVTDDDPDAGDLVVDLDDPLHYAFSTLPALMHEVQTRARREFVPYFTRIFWMLGLQVFDDRLWENETCLPVHGSLPQISHLYATRENLLRCGGRIPVACW